MRLTFSSQPNIPTIAFFNPYFIFSEKMLENMDKKWDKFPKRLCRKVQERKTLKNGWNKVMIKKKLEKFQAHKKRKKRKKGNG
jgi:hypothetical protein